MAKQPIQSKPVVFPEFTQFIDGDVPFDVTHQKPYELNEEELAERKVVERILRTVQGLRRKLDDLQSTHPHRSHLVGRDVPSGRFQSWVTGRISHSRFGS